MTEEEITALVESPEVRASNTRKESKSGAFITQVSNPMSIVLSEQLDVDDMRGILSVWEEDGILMSKLLLTSDGAAPEPFRVRTKNIQRNILG